MKISRNKGFTLVELLSVILLLGIVSVVATSRLDISPFRAASFEQELRSAIRFAQKFAIASGCDVQVYIDAGTDAYALTLRNDVNTAVPASCLTAVSPTFDLALRNPAGGDFSGNAPTGVDITAGLTFFYDGQGRPSASGAVAVGGQNIIIEPVTGYVH